MAQADITIRAGVVGATGYTGSELLRLLLQHPNIDLRMVTSRSESGVPLAEYWPNLRGQTDLSYELPNVERLAEQCDVIFFATPHTVAMGMAAELLAAGCRIIDLSADFRIRNVSVWEQWYGVKHQAPQLLDQAVYALPETNREAIKGADLLACPGCYPTAIQLGLLPLIENNLVEVDSLIANAASGVSGAGRQANVGTLFSEVSDNFKAYGVSGHRHLPEIVQELNRFSASEVSLTFVPHLLPLVRGIHATLYAKPKSMDVDWQQLYEQRYEAEPFVNVLPVGKYPETRSVKGTNQCRIAVQAIEHSGMLCIMSVEDNLTKGAAGQAVQAMNIMYDLPETVGLLDIALMP